MTRPSFSAVDDPQCSAAECAWSSPAARDALRSALHARGGGSHGDVADAARLRAFESLCDEAIAADRPPEAVVLVYRLAWDSVFSAGHGDDARDLRYYRTLSQCLDVYSAARGQSHEPRTGTARDPVSQSP